MVEIIEESLIYLRKGRKVSCRYSAKLDNGLDIGIDIKVPRGIAKSHRADILDFVQRKISGEISKLERPGDNLNNLRKEIHINVKYDGQRLEGRVTNYNRSFITVELDHPLRSEATTYVGDKGINRSRGLTREATDIARRALIRIYDSAKLTQNS